MSFVVNDSHVESFSAVAFQHDDWIIKQAIALLEERVFKDATGPRLNQPQAVKDYLRLKLVTEPDEVFGAVFMTSMHDVLAYEPLFRGTIDSTAVYPRVVVRRALELNAAAVIFSHQHPSGCTEPSSADRYLTEQLKAALALVDVRVLDHIIVGRGAPYSFAESGLL
ncbi:MAG: DNA repair protein RadC [Burkholderiales bacterium]|nr:DNA repair protein RadC [Burkholderiales bacterium]